MSTTVVLLAYFGPEIQLPLTSLIGAIVGFVLIAGRTPIRWLRRRFAMLGRFRKSARQ